MIQALPNRQAVLLCLFILFSLSLSARPASSAPAFSLALITQTETPQLLEPGTPIEKDLAGGQAHTFRVPVESGRFLRVIVEQQGIDVRLEIIAPDDQALAEMDGPFGKRGPESLSIMAVSAGDYRIRVRPASETARAGRYTIRIHELRA